MKKIVFRLVTVILAIVLSLAGVEILVRIFWTKLSGPAIIPLTFKTHRISPNPKLGYELVPGSESFEDDAWYRINKDGIRDRDFSRTKPVPVFRIAAVGDSCTFGLGLDLADTWPKQLESELRRDGPQIEVINFGVMGYNLAQEAELIQNKVLAYSPDLIVIGYSLNDIGVVSRERRELATYEGYGTFLTTGLGPIDRLLPKLKTYMLIKNRLYLKKTNADKRPQQYSKDGQRILKTGYAGFLLEAYEDPEKRAALEKDFDKIIQWTHPQIPVAVVIYPELADLRQYQFGEITGMVKKLCLEKGFSVLDPLPDFLAAKDQDLKISQANPHPNALGNKVFAQAAARFLRSSSLIGK